MVGGKGEEYTMGLVVVKCKAGKKWQIKPKKAKCEHIPEGFHHPLEPLG